MDAVVHRIEALPGSGRYAVTFRRADGSEQTAVAQVQEGTVEVAEASLPTGWTRDGEPFAATSAAVVAVHVARSLAPAASVLRDVDGGWDVSLGNVVLEASGTPSCFAHGDMVEDGEQWVCEACGARAAFG